MATRIIWTPSAAPAGWNSRTQRVEPQSGITALLPTSSGGIPRLALNSRPSPKRLRKGASPATAIGSIPSSLEAQFALIVRAMKLPAPMREFRFDPVRMWRFDFAWPKEKIAVELDGGIWTKSGKSGHNSGAGILRDMEKSNAAQLSGWTVLRFTDKHLNDGTALEQTKQALGIA